MFDQCLKILLIFGWFSAVARGEDEYASTTTSTDNYNECYAGDPDCDWQNDPSADQAWDHSSYDRSTRLYSYFDGSSPRGNSTIRVVSPIFSRDDNYGCIINYFQIYLKSTSGLVGLRVYQKPVHIEQRDLIAYNDEAKKDYFLYEVWGDQSDKWRTKEFPLKHYDSNFQIILEGIFGEFPVHMGICYMKLRQTTDCAGYTSYTIPNRQSTSPALSTTPTMSTTTTERAMREKDDTITDKVIISDTWVDSPSASPQSNLWPTTTWPTTLPTTKQPTTTQSLPKGNGCDSRNPPIILYLMAPGNSLIDFRVRPPCNASAASGAVMD